ncbi:hypothetical protein EIN_058650 [Entamoeba invadens IP1]|uniref:hypothetical protein n=1 Tax=Entamoeba invadens IP1 TaxID=370355 RepID=UPI0002C3D411|nr:hypothetical protein EIN_058650 [Entamoeba invadens IP1]ELP93410.1 hypothetical protein EIN_058650 [Entamoeba invadens IP1]|eukprot:XP_004260181.1 hypothetical protein EIN_058650 [Entamoeba invadens IP1]
MNNFVWGGNTSALGNGTQQANTNNTFSGLSASMSLFGNGQNNDPISGQQQSTNPVLNTPTTSSLGLKLDLQPNELPGFKTPFLSGVTATEPIQQPTQQQPAINLISQMNTKHEAPQEPHLVEKKEEKPLQIERVVIPSVSELRNESDVSAFVEKYKAAISQKIEGMKRVCGDITERNNEAAQSQAQIAQSLDAAENMANEIDAYLDGVIAEQMAFEQMLLNVETELVGLKGEKTRSEATKDIEEIKMKVLAIEESTKEIDTKVKEKLEKKDKSLAHVKKMMEENNKMLDMVEETL